MSTGQETSFYGDGKFVVLQRTVVWSPGFSRLRVEFRQIYRLKPATPARSKLKTQRSSSTQADQV